MASLWGEKKFKEVITPKELLDEQADELEVFSEHYLYGEVEKYPNVNLNIFDINCEREFNFAFMIKSKYIEEYSYKLLSIHYNLALYPSYIMIDSDILDSIEDELKNKGLFLGDGSGYPIDSLIIKNKDDMINALTCILQSSVITNILSTLISIAKQNCKSFK